MAPEIIFGENCLKPTPEAVKEYVSLKDYKQNLEINIMSLSGDGANMEFSIIGMFPALINALRRILLSEVPTMAVEKVYIRKNTSCIQDEVLAHRLGLVPLKANPRLFQFRLKGDQEGNDRDTLHFELKVKCTKNPNARYGHRRPEDMYLNYQVLSSQIKWAPIGEQKSLFKESEMGPVYDDIMIAKLRPGLEIDLKMEAVKGIGRDHAKFSPVGTAYFRLQPFIRLKGLISGYDALELKKYFSPGVIETKTIGGKPVAYVKNASRDFCSRNIFMDEPLTEKVVCGFVKDHYIFNIESVVAAKASELFIETLKILKIKCRVIIDELNEISSKKGS